MKEVVVIAAVLSAVFCLENGLARTPPMGWISWQRYRCNIDCKNQPDECISEGLYKRIADRMVQDGYRDAGYQYVNIDDCWSSKQRGANGTLVADPERFPSGIAALAKYMHDRGLKLGIYSDVGETTCAGYPASKNYIDLDAQTFADWGVDMLKFDGCNLDVSQLGTVYQEMQKALNKTGRDILYSCEWPFYEWQANKQSDYGPIQKTCNMWRNYNDIGDSWDSLTSIIDYYVNNQDKFVQYAKPGAFFDPDMLLVGNFGLSVDESQLQMALWAIFASPLMMSNNLEKIGKAERDILLNPYVIAINQDKMGSMGSRVKKDGGIELFVRFVSSHSDSCASRAIAVVNRQNMGGGPTTYELRADDVLLSAPLGYYVTDLFDNNRLVTILKPGESVKITVNPAGVRFFKATVIGC